MFSEQGNRTDRDLSVSVRLYTAAVIAGVAVGGLGGVFQILLKHADVLRLLFAEKVSEYGTYSGFLLILLVCVLSAAAARFIVIGEPRAAGSGIQYTEALWLNETEPSPLSLVPRKFFGALLALGSGMALGREGPTVQMGEALGAFAAERFGFSREDRRILAVSSAGAGLGVAFSAPLSAVLFTHEEVTRVVTFKTVAVSLLCSAAACSVSVGIVGVHPDYSAAFRSIDFQQTSLFLAYAVFGAVSGVLGVLYNRFVLTLLLIRSAFPRITPEVYAGLVGATVAVLLWSVPDLAGSGEAMTQRLLNGAMPLSFLILIASVRWIIGPLCYSSGVPGGLFAPLILMGGVFGQIFAVCISPCVEADPVSFSAVGMAAFFAAAVQAPATGVLLVLEMTACWQLMIPMMTASAFAYITASAMGEEGIYTSLRKRVFGGKKITC